ncbi:LexA family transcriptional regulator [Riemerella anatipestifer]|uniref:LexA family transcriptional regulator n=1 Tax=Riemerella anatipestifer TaxID=34085 RepID=UPI001623722E|nr:LexA family transcriptional regulator [Riemerella anatipestifer]
MSNIIDKSLILKKIKEVYDFKSDTEFANFLGVKPQTISSWHSRNTFDTDLIYSKCVNINADFLLSGEGEVLKPNVKEKLYNESITNSITESITNQMYKKGYTSNEDTKTKSKENVLKKNEDKNEDNFIPVLNRLKFAEGIDISNSGAPFYPLPVTAGDNAQFLEVQEEKPTGYISIPGVYCRAFFPVVGFSFEPHIKAGDIIGIDFVDRWERLDPDAIYFIITQDQRMIKRLVDDPENPDKLICISPNFREFSIWKEEIRAIHKVVFYGRLA